MRKSARYIGRDRDMSTSEVYETWEQMGLVEKNPSGMWWDLTEEGKQHSGRLSSGNYPVPTFWEDEIHELMDAFLGSSKEEK